MYPQLLPGNEKALGAAVLWSLGSVAGMEIEGAAFFVGEPANNGWESPEKLVLHQHGLKYFVKIPIHLLHGPYKPVPMAALIK
jgi:hypothetical protein